MKNRSNRLPISDQLDDWVDGSWTVDCVCGVNFDDGEEMVNCDECGVWVHTRCSRYVKSEKLFACDKCKSKRSRNNSEETEVAQLLVELPTKTLGMQNPNQFFGREPLRRPFRLWTDIPMEDRVHVQGVPGGDATLFGGVSSVFSPELWKCTGHVPKKFNFQYREFPSWDKDEDDKKMDILADLADENPASKGAGVLFSLSKENDISSSPVPVATYLKRQVGQKKTERENGVKKDKAHSGKRKKDDNRSLKDQIGKKKDRKADKDGDSKKKATHTSKPVGPTTISSDAKLKEDKGSKIVKPGNSVVITDDSLSDSGFLLVEKADEEKNLAFSDDVSRHNSSSEAKEENAKTDGDDVALLLLNHNHNDSVKEEVVCEDRNKQNNNKESSERVEEEKKIQDSAQEDKKGQVLNGESSHPVAESLKIDSPHISADNMSEDAKVIDSSIDCSKSNSELNVQVTDKNTVVSHCQTDESQRKMVISVGKLSTPTSEVKPSSTKSKKENNSNNNSSSNDKIKIASKDEQRKSSSRIMPHSVLKRSSSQTSQPGAEPSESAGTRQAEAASQRGGKMNQHSSAQPPMHPPPAPLNSQANLSDEELALLLHQELNSSPRVPRVPRMRNTGTVPQLGSPTSTSTLLKRTSKDHSLVLRRKNKDVFKDGTRNSHEVENETKVDKRKSSSERSKHDTTDDPLEAVEKSSHKGSKSVAKSVTVKSPPPPSTTTASSGGRSSSAEGNDQNVSSTRSSLNVSDDDTNGTVRRTAARTLPALIADIMSKGKRMAYEELCNAVLPHWPNLRKHNGERYAYSSHLQAVLDCLRNRSEWARLVDRGPKTNASRKRRKPDAEHSEDNNEVENTKSSEKHPKQKRNRQVRKRRRLAKQETSTSSKDPRRRHKAKVVSDDDEDDVDDNDGVDDDVDDDEDENDDVDLFSNFTTAAAAANANANACSEDEGGSREASDSSDETENSM